MPSIIKIKRSGTAVGAPGSLKSGELAYTYSAGVNRLYFGKGDDGSGNATSIVQIGGEFYTDLLSATAGTLTASKALIVDSNSKLDNLKVDNIDLNGNTISSTDTNGNLILVPNGSGSINFYNAYTFPSVLGASGQALVSNGSGGLVFANVNVASTSSNIAGGTAGQVPYQTAPGITGFYGPGTAGQILVSAGTSAPTYTNTSSIYVNRATVADATQQSVTFNNSNTGDASGTTFNGNIARTVSANTLGALSLSAGGVVSGSVTFSGPVVFSGTATYVLSTQTFYTDNIINLHVPPTGVDGQWTFDDGKDVGLRFHYYRNSTDTNAALVLGNQSKFLEWYSSGAEGTSTFVGSSYGIFRTGGIRLVGGQANTENTNTGDLQVSGGVGIAGSMFVGGLIIGRITTSTNLAGGTAGQLVYQTSPGVTEFAGPGTAGQLLVSAGTGAPTYTNTGSIYVGRAVDADKWATPRTITFTGDTTGTFTIDGSANVSNVNLTIQPDSVSLGTDTTGIYVAAGATSGFGISGSATAEGQVFTVTSNATSTNAVSSIVYRDGSGNFSAGVVTADLLGTANNANDLTGGAEGSLPYQSGAGITVFLPLGLDGKILQVSTATNSPVWGDIDGGTY